jgi:RNA polymerase sigma-70 factor (family 1)
LNQKPVNILEKLDDKTTIEALRQGNRNVFDALFRAYYEPLCNYACSIVDANMDVAEDIVQERFFKLWEKREETDIRYSVKAYLYKMVYNACLNHIRHEKTQAKYKLYNAIYVEQNPTVQAEGAYDIQENVQKAIASLPEQCRHVFELNRFEELKYREIADLLGISIKTVENHIGKALRIMREKLSEYMIVLMFVMLYLIKYI